MGKIQREPQEREIYVGEGQLRERDFRERQSSGNLFQKGQIIRKEIRNRHLRQSKKENPRRRNMERKIEKEIPEKQSSRKTPKKVILSE